MLWTGPNATVGTMKHASVNQEAEAPYAALAGRVRAGTEPGQLTGRKRQSVSAVPRPSLPGGAAAVAVAVAGTSTTITRAWAVTVAVPRTTGSAVEAWWGLGTPARG